MSKFWEWWDNISIKHFLFMIVTSLSVLTIGIVGKVWIMPELTELTDLPTYWTAVNTFHWCFIGVGIALVVASAVVLFAVLDIV